jgi:hypothetical protein
VNSVGAWEPAPRGDGPRKFIVYQSGSRGQNPAKIVKTEMGSADDLATARRRARSFPREAGDDVQIVDRDTNEIVETVPR